jgi:putative tricarboxylic transport membrane protein
MEFLFITFPVAVVVGILVGLLPGIGMLNAMILCWVFLSQLDAVNLLVFYAVVASISQFVGSVVASTTGIPGELSSVPACIEGPRLFSKNQGINGIAMSAIGSLIGTTVVGVLVLLFLGHLSSTVLIFYNNNVQTVIFTSVMLVMLITTSNKFYINVLLMLVGIGLSLIGSSIEGTGSLRFNFGINELTHGIPLEILAITMFAIPQIVQHLALRDCRFIPEIPILPLVDGIKQFKQYMGASARGTVIGAITGLIPGLTWTLSSKAAYYFEKLIRKQRNVYKEDGDIHSLVSSETANNSGVLVAMIPVFLFGLPIMGSEAMLISLIEQTGVSVGFATLAAQEYFAPTVLMFLLSGILGVFIAWQGASLILKIFKLPDLIIKGVLLSLLMVSVLYAGYLSQELVYYSIIFLALAPVGLLLRKFDTSIILFAFLVYPRFEGSLIRFFVLNF